MKPLPLTVRALINQLDEDFPELCAREGESIESIWRRAGARELVNILIERQKNDDQEMRVKKE